MAIDDPEPQAHRISTPEDRDRLLAEAMAHAEVQEAHYRRPIPEAQGTRSWKRALSLVVLVIALYLAVAPPPWLAGPPPPTLNERDLVRGVRAALQLEALQIDVFHERSGRIPDDIQEVPASVGRVRLVRSNNRVYQLVAPGPNGEAIIFDSARPDSDFDDIVAAWKVGLPSR